MSDFIDIDPGRFHIVPKGPTYHFCLCGHECESWEPCNHKHLTAKAPEPDFDEKRTAPGSYPEELENDIDSADYDPA